MEAAHYFAPAAARRQKPACFAGLKDARAHDKPDILRKQRMAEVLALVDDIFFLAKMQETAKHVGIALRACTTADALFAEIEASAPRLIVVDLNARNQPLEALEKLQANSSAIPRLAFLSHVQVELAQRAREAGCTNVMPRSKFTRDLAAIFTEAKSPAP
jgi:DNA-binding NarL/FixJ family response regulator